MLILMGFVKNMGVDMSVVVFLVLSVFVFMLKNFDKFKKFGVDVIDVSGNF